MPTTIFLCGGKVETSEPLKEIRQPSGIDITYTKFHKALSIGGWYDGFVGIENVAITLLDFCRLLNIPASHLRKVAEELSK